MAQKIPLVDLHAQYLSLKTELDSAVSRVILDSAFIGGYENPYVQRFESAFGHYVGASHCIGCGNGTDAIEILLKALGIGSGDEVIVPALSWIATSEAVTTVGARPVFVDILPDRYTIDPALIESKINSKTRAIIPVHLYGLPAEMDEILSIAERHSLKVIEDCAQAHGATYRGRKVGTLGSAGSFSFFPGKNLGAYGDAGGMVTNDAALAARARAITNHGQVSKNRHLMEGRNSRLDGIQAAILSVKLAHLEEWTEARIRNAKVYDQCFRASGICPPEPPSHSRHVYHLYVLAVEERERIQAELRRAGIASGVHYPTPLPLLDAYANLGFKAADFPVAHRISSRVLSLPMYPELEENAIRAIADAVCRAVVADCPSVRGES